MRHPRQRSKRPLILVAILSLLATSSVLTWIGPPLAGWVNSGRWSPIGFWRAQAAVIRAIAGKSPTIVYPPGLRAALPSPAGFWTVQALIAITLAAGAVALVRELDIHASRPVSDRRWWQLRGLRPRSFGRAQTIRSLLVDRPTPDRIVIGTYGRPSRLLAVESNVQTLIVAAPRSGKTSGVIIPALLEDHGAAVSTVRTDVLQNTVERRRQVGRVWVWDPFGTTTDSWDPLQGCEDWEHALLVASLAAGRGVRVYGAREVGRRRAEGVPAGTRVLVIHPVARGGPECRAVPGGSINLAAVPARVWAGRSDTGASSPGHAPSALVVSASLL